MFKIRDCMKSKVFSVPSTATVKDAVNLLVQHHIGLLPVLDADGRPLGVVGLRDLLDMVLPAVMRVMTDVDFVGDFGAVEAYRPTEQVLSRPITELMRAGAVVTEDSGLLRSYALMLQYELHDLPVVDQDGRLTGIASRVDIGTTILASWGKKE